MIWEGAWGDQSPPLGQVHGIVRHGARWFIAQQGEGLPAIVEFSETGRRVAAWGMEFGAGAHGLRLDSDSLWLTDHRAGRVVQCTLEGRLLTELPPPRAGWQPTEIACAPDGRRFVADGYGSGFIDVFASDHRHMHTFGGPSGRTFSRCAAWEDPGFLAQPHGLCVLKRHGEWEVLIADRRHNRLQAFTLDGIHRAFLHGGVRYPCTVVAWGPDRLVVPDLYGCVHVLDHQGNRIQRLGDSPQIWDQPGWPDLAVLPVDRFVAPHCVWADPDGTLTVGEWTRPGRIVRLRSP